MLSLGGRLMLVNSILASIQTYWMSIYKLPSCVIKVINNIRHDFLWRGPKTDKVGCRLVSWKCICRPCDLGGWVILNLVDFNLALLGNGGGK